MKRITVQVFVASGYPYRDAKIKAAMINAAVGKATEENVEIMGLNSKIGHVTKVS